MTETARLVGEKSIAAHLRVQCEDTVRAWGDLSVDPLPLRDWMGSVVAWPPYLDEWVARRADLASWRARLLAWRAGMPREPSDRWFALNPQPQPLLPIWESWERIAAELGPGVSVDTAERAAKAAHRPLPVIGVCDRDERLTREGGPPRVWIYRSAQRDWIASRDQPHQTGQARPRAATDGRQMSLFEKSTYPQKKSSRWS